MEFLTEKDKEERYYKPDKILLSVANYLYNNEHSEKKSPHYAAILQKINKIDPRFLDIASRFRPITDRSPALSQFSLETKRELVNMVKPYIEEIYQGSRSEPQPSPQKKAFDIADYESKYQEPNQPLTYADRLGVSSMESGVTDQEASDSFTDLKIEEMSDRSSTVTFQPISLENIKEALSPSPEFRENAVGLLLQFIQSNSPQETNAEYRTILAAIKIIIPTVVPKLAKLDLHDLKSLSKKELNGLYNFAGLYREPLNRFQEQLEQGERQRFDH